MKTKIILCILLMASQCLFIASAQPIVNYVESNTIISNPGRGLQKYSITNSSYNTQTNYSNLNQTTLTGWRTGTDKVTVIFRYFLLDAYLNSDISQTYLNNIQRDFDIIRNAGLKCIVRFSYSNAQSSAPQQPSKSQLLTHINQLSPVLTANKDIILTFQAGFIGTWGEWYYTNSTEFGTDGSVNDTQWGNRKQVVDAMLAAVPPEIYVQVRYPAVKTKMYGTTKLTSATAYQNSARARVGFFNDAFLNNWGDMGTYGVGSQNQNPVGTTDYVYLANETQYTPMTGETNGLNSPRTSGSNAIYEMDSTNWSCLNRDYHTDVWNTWISSGNYDEILRRLGYRFVLKSSEFNLIGTNLSVNVKMDNKGFARVFSNIKAYLILQNTSNNNIHQFQFAADPRSWDKSVVVQETFNIGSLPDGDYEAFLFLPDNNTTLSSRPEYAIRFANDNVWQASSGYNKLSQTVTKSTANQLPTVSITAPANGSTYTAPANMTINATASDADGSISKVEFYNGTTLLNTDNTSPYSYVWSGIVAGTYSLTAKAYDNLGAVTTSAVVSITVNPANQLPTVSITAPTNGATYTAPANVTINATASDADGSISKVEFYNGTTLLNTDNTSPYSYVWSGIVAGTYSLTAKAYDNLGAVTTSAVVSITINPANQLPTVSITAPTNGATYTAPANVTINATASDADGSISKVEFYNGTTLLNTDNTSPYSYVWSGIVAGTYSLTAKAYDNLGAVRTSSIISITVNGQTGTENCSNIANWNSASIYVKDDLVVFNGAKYKAKWWTQNNSPATNSGQWDVWIKLGECMSNTLASVVPTISVTPGENTSITLPESLSMNVTDISAGSITQVSYILYKDQEVSQAIVEHGPDFSASWNALEVGDYLLQVITKDQNGMLIYSDAKSVKVSQVTGISSELNTEMIRVIPNPNNAKFHLSVPENINLNGAKLELIDMIGQKIYESVLSSKDEEIRAGELKAGAYLLKVVADGKMYTTKIYIN